MTRVITPDSLARRLNTAMDRHPGPLPESDRHTAMRLVKALDEQGRLTKRQLVIYDTLVRRVQARARRAGR